MLVKNWPENVPLANVVLVVEGTLRVSGRDPMGDPFTLRRIHPANGGGFGVHYAACHQQRVGRRNQPSYWQFQ